METYDGDIPHSALGKITPDDLTMKMAIAAGVCRG
jgi:hypothetical protein